CSAGKGERSAPAVGADLAQADAGRFEAMRVEHQEFLHRPVGIVDPIEHTKISRQAARLCMPLEKRWIADEHRAAEVAYRCLERAVDGGSRADAGRISCGYGDPWAVPGIHCSTREIAFATLSATVA